MLFAKSLIYTKELNFIISYLGMRTKAVTAWKKSRNSRLAYEGGNAV